MAKLNSLQRLKASKTLSSLPPWTPRSDDILVLVMGPSGSGKSTFINAAAGVECTVVGHGLDSSTTEIEAVAVDYPSDRGARIVFVEMPGFDNTTVEDNEILRKISEWLEEMSKQEAKIAGIIYLHEILQARMGRTLGDIYDTFIELCGDEAMTNVVIATTKWDQIGEKEGDAREEQLKAFWSTEPGDGSITARYTHTDESARDIVNLILSKEPLHALQFQWELVERGKTQSQTPAGITLHQRLQNLFVWRWSQG